MTPPVTDADPEALPMVEVNKRAREATIILVSQDGEPGYQLHGLFSSFSDAADHVAKDENNEHRPVWIESAERQQWATKYTVWVASRQPVRSLADTKTETAMLREALEASEYLASLYERLWKGGVVRDLPEAMAVAATTARNARAGHTGSKS